MRFKLFDEIYFVTNMKVYDKCIKLYTLTTLDFEVKMDREQGEKFVQEMYEKGCIDITDYYESVRRLSKD